MSKKIKKIKKIKKYNATVSEFPPPPTEPFSFNAEIGRWTDEFMEIGVSVKVNAKDKLVWFLRHDMALSVRPGELLRIGIGTLYKMFQQIPLGLPDIDGSFSRRMKQVEEVTKELAGCWKVQVEA